MSTIPCFKLPLVKPYVQFSRKGVGFAVDLSLNEPADCLPMPTIKCRDTVADDNPKVPGIDSAAFS